MSNDTKTTEPTRDACVTYLQTHGIYSGHSRDSIDQLRTLVRVHKSESAKPARKGPSPADVAQGVAALEAELKANAKAIGDALDGSFLFPEGPDRVAAAKTEHKLLQAWIKDGEKPPRPATPNLDALNEAYAAGETAAMRHRRTKGKKATAESVPAPTVTKGQVMVQLRNAAHGEVVSKCLHGERAVGVVHSEVTGQWLVIQTTEAQSVFDSLVRGTEGASQFTTRLLVLAQLLVRQTFPKVTDARNGLVPRLVNHLCGSGASWSVTWATDATPVFTIDGQTYTTTRAAAEAVAVPTKAVSEAA